jgi:carboxypeptidase C (cathepsin A)
MLRHYIPSLLTHGCLTQAVIPGMLASGVKVMVYAGDKDFICNWVGNQQWVQKMQYVPFYHLRYIAVVPSCTF